jgi:hypothetical protein
MHDGGGGGFSGHDGGHVSSDSGMMSHHSPSHHWADDQFTSWNTTQADDESFPPQRGGRPGGIPAIFRVILAVVMIAVFILFAVAVH